MRTVLLAVLLLQVAPALAQQGPPSAESLRQLFAASHVNKFLDAYMAQLDSGIQAGMRSANTTRLAGFEIGSTKLAALAMKAQTNR